MSNAQCIRQRPHHGCSAGEPDSQARVVAPWADGDRVRKEGALELAPVCACVRVRARARACACVRVR
eukprot:576599-Pleurochrysis_carterae.AAC.1